MRQKFVLGFILLLALFLRGYGVAENPPSMSWDEVSIGYNAYSILKTGRDEHGKFLPFDSFAAYGDYKPPLSIYVTVPFVAMFGLSEFSVRLPAVLFGTFTVLLTYMLVGELLWKYQRRNEIQIISALILAISPWHINLSRAGFEATIALFFVVFGSVLVLRAVRYPKLWFVAWLPFVASMYTFNSARYFSILFAAGLVLYVWPSIQKHFRHVILGIACAFIVLVPTIPHLISKEARLRYAEVNIFTESSVVEIANQRIERQKDSSISKILNNRRIGYLRSYILHFLDNLEPLFLFIRGDGNPKFSIQDVGQLYIIEAPFLVIGILKILGENPRVGILLLYWLVAAIVPAGVARETPHALRILNSLPTWHIFISYGIVSVLKYASGRRALIAKLLLIFFYVFSCTYYLHTYWRHYPVEFAREWQYGYKQALELVAPMASSYDRIVITDAIGRPYMYTLFYMKTDPQIFWNTKKDFFDAAGFYHVDGFDKYVFGGSLPVNLDGKTLYVWGSVPEGAKIKAEIRLPDGTPVLYIFS